MGNCFGKPASNFKGEGRTLGAQPARIPASAPSEPSQGPKPSQVEQPPSLRTENQESISAAGRAAQERMTKANAATGKLGQQLAEQKKQTRNDTLNAVSEEERRLRDAQANAEARNWN